LTNIYDVDIIILKGSALFMYSEDFAQIGANIKRQLDNKGMTQQALADSLGISKQVMNKIIKGTKATNVSELGKIADVLNVSTNYLLSTDEKIDNVDYLSFMGFVNDEDILKKIDNIKTAIDEIHMLEELLND